MHVASDEFYIMLKVRVIRSKVKVTEVMAAKGGGTLRYTNTSSYFCKMFSMANSLDPDVIMRHLIWIQTVCIDHHHSGTAC